MGEPDVDDIIDQWRASARAAGESATPVDRETSHGLLQRLGWIRVVGAAGALLIFGWIAAPIILGGSPDAPAPDPIASVVPVAPDAGAGATDPAPPPAVDEWYGLIQSADHARGAAYRSAGSAALPEFFHPDGPAFAREAAAVEALAVAGLAAEGWGTALLSVSPVEVTGEQVRLRVQDRRGEYALVDGAGVRTTVPAADAATWLVELRQAAGRWLVFEAVPEVTSQTGLP